MAKINLVAETLERHTDQEVIEHLSKVMLGVVKNYKVAFEKGDSSVLWGNLGDLELVTSMLSAMNKKNQERNVV